jgi:hypothetical protein
MSKKTLFLAVPLAVLFAWCFTAPAQACEALHSASLCAIVPPATYVRDAPNGRFTYSASGKVLIAGRSKNGQWARIGVPCAGFKGWIVLKDLACETTSVSAQETAKP